jgi:hypothetical protein
LAAALSLAQSSFFIRLQRWLKVVFDMGSPMQFSNRTVPGFGGFLPYGS